MYENSRFLKNRFTFCGVDTNFGQQWAPPAYYHLTPIVSKGKHCMSVITVEKTDLSITKKQMGWRPLNTLRPRRNGHHFADDIFKHIFFNENIWISIQISLKSVPKDPINNIPSLVQIMAWRRPGDKPISEPMMVSLMTHICITRPQWVNLFPT